MRLRTLVLALVLALAATPALALPSLERPLEPLDPAFDAVAGDSCDPIDPTRCLLPFPNDHYTVADEATVTGRRVNIDPAATPRVLGGTKPIFTDELNRNDGFSPGAMVMAFVDDLDLHQTWGTTDVEPVEHRDHIANPALADEPDAPILVINADTGERHPFWSELDTHKDTDDDERMLIIRPLRNFDEATRYLVVLRDLRDGDGSVIPAGEAFTAYRDGDGDDADRQEAITRILDEAAAAESARGNAFDRDEVHLAWEFTVASAESIAGRALHIRDDAFARLGDTDLADLVVEGDSPAVRVDRVEPGGDDTHAFVHGFVTVPNYLAHHVATEDIVDPTGFTGERMSPFYVPGSRFYYPTPPALDPDVLPELNPLQPEVEVPFTCRIPSSALPGEDGVVDPAMPILYGHGLLGQRYEVGWSSGHMLTRDYNAMYCGTEWLGMALGDLPNVATILADPSNFASLADRAQQGFLQFLFLGRAMIHADGLASLPEFQADDGTPLIDTTELMYEGNSQGGIMGGAVTALSPDFTKAVLGVPGMNYSTLLNRNTGGWEGDDPTAYGNIYYTSITDSRDRQLGFALLQMLWDRAEGNGYAHHMTDDPYPNTPPHQVVLHTAFADYQVANITNEVQARTMGARVIHTALAPGRHWSVDPLYQLEPFAVATPGATGAAPFAPQAQERAQLPSDGSLLPHTGSALVYWDSGNPTPPNGNVPPEALGQDPHGDTRSTPLSGVQRHHFFSTGEIIDVHDGAPYCTNRFPRHPELFPDGCPQP
jgi:hypothetical protein